MTRLIDIDAVVAEIEKKIKLYEAAFDSPSFASYEACLIAKGKYRKLLDILSYINTLEVKGVDLEKDVRQIISLYYEGIKYYEDVIRKEREENGGSDLAIKIMDGVVDARELSIQYVIDKLKAQKGE